MSTRQHRTAASVALVAAGAAALAGSLALSALGGGAAASGRASGVVPALEVGVAPATADEREPEPGPGPRAPAPERVRAARVGLDARVVPIRTDRSGALRVPDDGGLVGWWAAGPRPGDATGTTVLTGHVDTWDEGAGVMARASRLRPGDRVDVGNARFSTAYRVVGVRSYPKQALPADVFAGYGRPRLVLVTCGGAFDERTRSYADNVVVYALPEPPADLDGPD